MKGHTSGPASLTGRASYNFNHALSGLINGLLMFFFCCVFSTITFNTHQNLTKFVTAGVGMQAVAALIGGLVFSRLSGLRSTIAGPDINPALFYGSINSQIVRYIMDNNVNENKMLPTVLFMQGANTLVIGALFFLLGYFRSTRIVQYIPACLLHGFLACIGYKVLKAALQVTTGDYYRHPKDSMFWKPLCMAVPLGLALYLAKKMHIGKPSLVILIAFVPLLIFYIVHFAFGYNLVEILNNCTGHLAVETNCNNAWFFDQLNSTSFYDPWKQFSITNVEFRALNSGLSDSFSMLVLVVVDYLVQLASTKKAIGCNLHFDNEFKIAGMATLCSGLCLGMPTYAQTKFTLLNYDITHDITSFVPPIICALLNGLFYVIGFPLINFIPRFFLGGILLYAGLGFIVDNLIGSKNHVAQEEFLAIWAIFIINAAVSLMAALVSGLVLSAIIFAIAYGRIGVVESVISGGSYQSKTVRSDALVSKLEKLSQKYQIIHLHHFIFFLSASQVLDIVKKFLRDEANLRKVERVRYVIFDWTAVDGIDHTSIGVFTDISKLLHENGVITIFTGCSNHVVELLASERGFDHVRNIFHTFDLGVEWVEEELLLWAHQVRKRWLSFQPAMAHHELEKLRAKFDTFENTSLGFGSELWKFAKRRRIQLGKELCSANKIINSLFIVQSGKFASVKTDVNGNLNRVVSYSRGAYINESCLFVSMPQEYSIVAAAPNSVALEIDQISIHQMEANNPDLILKLQKKIMSHFWHSNSKVLQLHKDKEDDRRLSACTGRRMSNTYKENHITNESKEAIGKYEKMICHAFVAALAVKNVAKIFKARTLKPKSKQEEKKTNMTLLFQTQSIAKLDLTRMFDYITNVANSIQSEDYIPVEAKSRNCALKARGDSFSWTIRMPRSMEAKCRSCFRFHSKGLASMNLEQVDSALRELNHYISLKEMLGILQYKDIKASLNRANDPAKIYPVANQGELKMKRGFIESLPLFSSLKYSPENHQLLLDKFAKLIELKSLAYSDHIFRQGATVLGMYVVVEGEVSQYMDQNVEIKKRLHSHDSCLTLCPESLFTERDTDDKHGMNAVVESDDAIMLFLSRENFRNAISESEHAFKLMKNASKALLKREKQNGAELEAVFSAQEDVPSLGEKVSILGKLNLFKEMVDGDQALLTRLAGNAKFNSFKYNDYILYQGEQGDSLEIVITGNVLIFHDQGTFPAVNKSATKEKGFLLGEVAFFSDAHVRSANVIAASDEVHVLSLSRNVLNSLFGPKHFIWTKFKQRAEKKRKQRTTLKKSSNGSIFRDMKLSRKIYPGIQKSKEVKQKSETREAVVTKARASVMKPLRKASTFSQIPTLSLKSFKVSRTVSKTDEEGGNELIMNKNLYDAKRLSSIKVKENEFIQLVQSLRFVEIPDETIFQIYEVFTAHADYETVDHNVPLISSWALVRLADAFKMKGELNSISAVLQKFGTRFHVREGFMDDKKEGFLLNFDELVSMLSWVSRLRELEQKVEHVFLALIGKRILKKRTAASMIGEAWESQIRQICPGEGIHIEDIKRGWGLLFGRTISDEACEELIFEADVSGVGYITFENWLNAISWVHDSEIEISIESSECDLFETPTNTTQNSNRRKRDSLFLQKRDSIGSDSSAGSITRALFEMVHSTIRKPTS